MPASIAGHSSLIFLVLVFIAFMLLFEGLYMIWKAYKSPEAQTLARRLQALSGARDKAAQAQIIKSRMLSEVPALQRVLLRIPRAQALDRLILQAGLDWSVSKLLLLCLASGAFSFAGVVLLANQPMLIGLLAGGALAMAPLLYIQHQRMRRLKRIEAQLPEALDLVTRALRSGQAFASGLQMIGEEMADPIAAEFRTVHDEITFGVSLQQALTHLSERIPIMDLRYFVVAVLIQRDSGGNLTEVLSNLSRLIRERLKLLAKVRVLSSEGRLSAWILGVMPFALAGLLNVFNPQFMAPLWTDPIGISIVKSMLLVMAVGVLMLRKIVRIHV